MSSYGRPLQPNIQSDSGVWGEALCFEDSVTFASKDINKFGNYGQYGWDNNYDSSHTGNFSSTSSDSGDIYFSMLASGRQLSTERTLSASDASLSDMMMPGHERQEILDGNGSDQRTHLPMVLHSDAQNATATVDTLGQGSRWGDGGAVYQAQLRQYQSSTLALQAGLSMQANGPGAQAYPPAFSRTSSTDGQGNVPDSHFDYPSVNQPSSQASNFVQQYLKTQVGTASDDAQAYPWQQFAGPSTAQLSGGSSASASSRARSKDMGISTDSHPSSDRRMHQPTLLPQTMDSSASGPYYYQTYVQFSPAMWESTDAQSYARNHSHQLPAQRDDSIQQQTTPAGPAPYNENHVHSRKQSDSEPTNRVHTHRLSSPPRRYSNPPGPSSYRHGVVSGYLVLYMLITDLHTSLFRKADNGPTGDYNTSSYRSCFTRRFRGCIQRRSAWVGLPGQSHTLCARGFQYHQASRRGRSFSL